MAKGTYNTPATRVITYHIIELSHTWYSLWNMKRQKAAQRLNTKTTNHYVAYSGDIQHMFKHSTLKSKRTNIFIFVTSNFINNNCYIHHSYISDFLCPVFVHKKWKCVKRNLRKVYWDSFAYVAVYQIVIKLKSVFFAHSRCTSIY